MGPGPTHELIHRQSRGLRRPFQSRVLPHQRAAAASSGTQPCVRAQRRTLMRWPPAWVGARLPERGARRGPRRPAVGPRCRGAACRVRPGGAPGSEDGETGSRMRPPAAGRGTGSSPGPTPTRPALLRRVRRARAGSPSAGRARDGSRSAPAADDRHHRPAAPAMARGPSTPRTAPRSRWRRPPRGAVTAAFRSRSADRSLP